jgi:hypothetical protein
MIDLQILQVKIAKRQRAVPDAITVRGLARRIPCAMEAIMSEGRSKTGTQRPVKGLDLIAFVASVLLAIAVYKIAGVVAMSTVFGAAAGLYILWRTR